MVSQFGRVAADINKNSNDSVNSSSWAHGMLNATNQCPFSGMSLTSDTDTQGHYCHSTDQHVKNFGLDNNGTGDIFHRGICCDGCGVHPITGPRFKSKVKDDNDLCKMCFAGMGNATDYIRIDRPINGFRHLLPPLYGFYDPSPRIPPQMPPHPKPSIWSNLTQSNLDSRFVHDVTVADGTIMAPLTAFTKIWRMKNTGPTIWPYGSQLHWIGGNRMCSSRAIHVEIPKAGLHVNEEIDIAVDVTAPDIPGRYVSYWRMATPAGEKFGQRVWILIQVDASMKNSGEDSSNLNLPPVTSDLEAVNQNHPVDNVFAGNNIITDSENTSVDLPPKDQEISFPINDPLIVNNGDMSTAVSSLVFNPSEVVTALSSLPVGPVVSSGLYPSVGLDTDPISYPTVEFSVMPPVMSSGVATPPKVVVPPAGSGGRVVSDEEEQAMVDDLAQMGFKRVNLNKEILRINNYDMEKAIDDLCGVLEWDPLLDELKKMGFADEETNRGLLVKNNGSIKRVVMDLINGKKA